jgi:hypothetical protein
MHRMRMVFVPSSGQFLRDTWKADEVPESLVAATSSTARRS